ncbi:SOS response-associated peptidase [Pseudomonas borbori]
MCGRFVQAAAPGAYVKPLSLQGELFGEVSDTQIERYNVAPSTGVWVLTSEEGGARSQTLRWGWEPHWAKGGKPPAINARAETLWTSKFWAAARHHRLIVPADGWYEWVAAEGKQPYFLHAADKAPLYFAAVGLFPTQTRAEQDDDGFAIVTGAASGGLLDIHDRCPLALSTAVAAEWLDNATPAERIEEIVALAGLPADAFTWFRVGRSVGNVKNQGQALIAAIV